MNLQEKINEIIDSNYEDKEMMVEIIYFDIVVIRCYTNELKVIKDSISYELSLEKVRGYEEDKNVGLIEIRL
jgi:hypothetical protein